jgi:hypothetical protein
MHENLIRLAQRCAVKLIKLTEDTEPKTKAGSINQFAGMALTLAYIFEEMTDGDARDKTPRQLLQWAINLPIVPPKRRIQ